jgi:large subunit ribosomal protein L25
MRGGQVGIPASVRSEVGTRAARRLRAAGKIPAVVYGRGAESLPVEVDEAAFLRAVPQTAWYSTVIQLNIEGAPRSESKRTVMITEVQQDLVKRRILSVDFHRISLRERVQAHVPVVAVGQSPGIKQGGILEHLVHEIAVECLPTDIPEHFEADISALEIGHSLRVRDLEAPEGVRIAAPEDEVVMLVAPPVRVEEVAPAPLGEEGAVVAEIPEPEVIGEQESREAGGQGDRSPRDGLG